MKIGLIGVGTVGKTLKLWFENYTNHQLVCFDPDKGLVDSFDGIDCAFISVPVPPGKNVQDISILSQSVNFAKKYTKIVFIRSSVLPGTSDALGCIACPEFLTARRAYQDMCNLPILVGSIGISDAEAIFPGKKILQMKNIEAEIAKFSHNCFGAVKVTYFNLINGLCHIAGADYQRVLDGAKITGFIESEHTQVPGPDGKFGFGGTCFPGNIESMKQFCEFIGLYNEAEFFHKIQMLNKVYREGIDHQFETETQKECDA